MTELNAEGAATLPASPLLANERRRGLERLAVLAQPTEEDEDFRYGLINELDLSRYALSEPNGELRAASEVAQLLELVGARAAYVETLDGAITALEVADELLAQKVDLCTTAKSATLPAGFGQQLEWVDERFAALAQAFVRDHAALLVPDDAVIGDPIVFVHYLSGQASFPRTFISLGARAEATVIEVFVSTGSPGLVIPVTEIEVGEESDLAYHSIQQLDPGTWQLGYQLSRVQRSGILRSFAAALGGHYARLYTRSVLEGEAAESDLSAIYLSQGEQVLDFRTFQEHAAPRTTSRLVFKGAVDDKARSVYTGLIHMQKGAVRADASQTNRNLVLSEGAHADSVPNLDIEENDVRCSHASAVGPIDPEQRFYLESRGIPPEVAERLIVLGFFDDLLDKLSSSAVMSYLSERIAERVMR